MPGGIQRDATVHVRAEVDDDIATTAERLFSPLERAAQNVQSRLGAITSTLGATFANVATDVARVSTALGAIDLGASVNRYVRYREEVARTAASVKTSWESLAGQYKAVGDKTLVSDEAIARVSRGLQQTTFDASDSSKAIEALGNEAIATNRSLDQMAPIGASLRSELGQSFADIPDSLARIRTAADRLGTSGGPAALQAEVASLSSAISQFSLKTRADFAQAVGSIAELGRGLPAALQARVQQRVLGRLGSDTEGLRRQLGIRFEEFYDEQGHVRQDLGTLVERIQRAATRRWGLRAREVLSQPQNFGPEAAAAIMGFDRSEATKAATATLSTEAADRARAFRQSEIGEDIAKRLRIEQNKRDNGGGALAGIQASIGEFMSEHPLASLFGLSASGHLTGQFVRWAFSGGGGAGGVARMASPAARVAGGVVNWLGSSALGNLAGGAGMAALTYKALDAMGLGRFNDAIEPFRAQLQRQQEQTRVGRVYAIVRAAERATTGGFSPEAYREQLGPRLMAEIARDPALQSVASAAINGGAPGTLAQEAPQLAAALRDALKEVQLNVNVQLRDDSTSPHRVVAIQKGARQ